VFANVFCVEDFWTAYRNFFLFYFKPAFLDQRGSERKMEKIKHSDKVHNVYATKCYEGDQITKGDMGGAYTSIMHRGEGNVRGKRPLEGVRIATGYGLDGPGSIPGIARLFSSLQLPDRLWDLPSHPAKAYQRSFPAGKSAGA
jgi:hypothetical protein